MKNTFSLTLKIIFMVVLSNFCNLKIMKQNKVTGIFDDLRVERKINYVNQVCPAGKQKYPGVTELENLFKIYLEFDKIIHKEEKLLTEEEKTILSNYMKRMNSKKCMDHYITFNRSKGRVPSYVKTFTNLKIH